MIRIATTASLALAAVVCSRPESVHAPASASTNTAAVVHCQVPCGIYGDKLRIDLLMEDVATIEKAMGQIEELGAAGEKNFNQIVRWVTTKEEHAQKIQDQVAEYWSAQRIKLPAADADSVAVEDYHGQLVILHGLTVHAMKCKQTTDTAHTTALRGGIEQLVASYFDAEDLEHLRGSHGFGGEDHDHEGH